MRPANRFTAQSGGCIATLTLRSGGKILVRVSSINAVVPGHGGAAEHGASLHIGEPHPIKVAEPIEDVLEILGWEKLS